MSTGRATLMGRIWRQGGYSLIELMVALVIALFLIGGVLIVEQGVHQSHSDNSALAEIDDEERFTLTLLNEMIRRGGYYPDPTVTNLVSALPAVSATAQNSTSDQLVFQPGQAVYGVSRAGPTGSAAAGSTTDSIAIRYMTASGDGIPLCDGSSNPPGGGNLIYTNYLYLQDVGGGGGNQNHYLYCILGTANPATPQTITWGTPIQLVKNVQNMQIWYGVNHNDSSNNVDEYIPAADMATASCTSSCWTNVTAVKLLMTFTNPLSSEYNEKGQKEVLLFTMVVDLMGRTGP